MQKTKYLKLKILDCCLTNPNPTISLLLRNQLVLIHVLLSTCLSSSSYYFLLVCSTSCLAAWLLVVYFLYFFQPFFPACLASCLNSCLPTFISRFINRMSREPSLHIIILIKTKCKIKISSQLLIIKTNGDWIRVSFS